MAKETEVKIEYRVVNAAFKKGISENVKQITTLNKEFKLQKEEMKHTATASEKLEAEVSKLNKEYEIAQQKTRMTASALQNTKEITGENSKETQEWSNKLLDARQKEEALKNKITETNVKLKESVTVEKGLTEEQKRSIAISETRKAKLSELGNENDKLKSSSEKLNKQYELEVAQLGNNAKESDKAKLKQKMLADQMKNSAEQVNNLETQLRIAKREYGENSTEVDKLEKELLDAKIATQKFANEFAQSSNKLKNFGDKVKSIGTSMQQVGKGMTTHLSAPIVAGIGLSVKAASDFNSAFTGMKKTVDELKDSNGKVIISYDDLEKGIRNLAKTIPATTEEIAAVAESAGQLGISTDNVMSFTKVMLNMGQATNMTSEEAAVSLAKLANITKMPQKEFGRLGAAITELGNNSATTEKDIVDMSLRLAGSAKQANMSEADILGMAAAMSSVGINAEAGGGSMARVMQKINTDVMSGGGNLEKFAKMAGMSASDFQKAWKDDAAGALTHFVKGLGKAKEGGEDVTGALKKMGITSTQEVDTMLRLSGAGDLLEKSLKTSAKGWKENTALTAEAEKRYATFESKLKIVKNKIKDVGIEMGGPLMDALAKMLDALEPVLQAITNMAKAFSDASPAMQKTVMVIAAVVAAIGPVLVIIGKLLTAVGSISTFLSGPLAASIGAAIAPLLPWIAAIAAVVAAFALAYNKIKPFRDLVDKTCEVIKTGWKLVLNVFAMGDTKKIQELSKKLKTIIPADWVDNIVKATAAVREAFQRMKGAITGVIDVVTGKVKSVKELDNIFGGLFNEKELQVIFDFGQKIKESFETIKKAVQESMKKLGKAFSTLKEPLGELLEALKPIVDFIKEHFMQIIGVMLIPLLVQLYTVFNVVRGVLKNVTTVIKGVIKAFTGIVEIITGLFSGDGDTIKQGFADLFDGIIDLVVGFGKMFLDIVTGPIKDLWKIVKPYVDNFIEGLRNWWEGVKEATSNAFHSIVDPIVNTWNDIKQAISDKWEEIKQMVSDKLTAIADWLVEKWTTIRDNAVEAWQIIGDFLGPIIDWVVDLIKIPFNLLRVALEFIWTGIKAGLDIAWAAIAYAAGVAWGFIKENILQPIKSAYDWIMQTFEALGAWLSQKWEQIKQGAAIAWEGIKTYIIQPIQGAWSWVVQKFTELGAWLSQKWGEIKQGASNAWNGIKENIIQPIQGAWSWVTQKISSLATTISQKWNNIKQSTTSAWNGVKSAIVDPIKGAFDMVMNKINGIKNFFSNLKLKIPTPSMPKLPHFSLKTSSKTVFGKTITFPTGFDVQWYAKGGIMTQPTAFGMNGNKMMVGGEVPGTKEAVLPLNSHNLGEIGRGIENESGFKKALDTFAQNLTARQQPIFLNVVSEIDGRQVGYAAGEFIDGVFVQKSNDASYGLGRRSR